LTIPPGLVSTLLLLIVFKLWIWNHVVIKDDDTIGPVNLTEKNSIPETEITNEDYCDQQPQVVIDPGRAFCQRIKFVMRMKRRMRDFKSRKEKNQLYLTEQKNK